MKEEGLVLATCLHIEASPYFTDVTPIILSSCPMPYMHICAYMHIHIYAYPHTTKDLHWDSFQDPPPDSCGRVHTE